MLIDIAIVLLALWALSKGWQNGLLKEITSSIGFLVGLLVASLFYTTLGDYLGMDGTANYITNIIAFIILWIITPIVLGFVANNLTACLKGLRMGWANSLLGAIVSILKYLILMSCVFNVMSILGIVNAEKAAGSHLYRPVKGALSFIFREVKSAATHSADDSSDTLWVYFNSSEKNATDKKTTEE